MCFGFSFLFDDTRKITAYLVDLDILAHSQCGPHSWDKHLHKFLQGQQDARYTRMKWNYLRILLMEETEGMEAGSQTLWESNCSLISQANIPEGQGQAKWGHGHWSGYATFVFATWTVSFQSDYSFHNWWGCHLLHKKCFLLETYSHNFNRENSLTLGLVPPIEPGFTDPVS